MYADIVCLHRTPLGIKTVTSSAVHPPDIRV